MAKHLMIGGDPHGSWHLPAEYDTEALRSDLEEAFQKGTFAWIAVEPDASGGQRAELIVNGRVVPFVAIID